MSTCNFGLPHMAKSIHAFGMNNDENEGWYYEDALNDVKYSLESNGIYLCESGNEIGWLDSEFFSLNKIDIFIEPHFFYESGYYEGGMLDFYFKISISDNDSCGFYEDYECKDYDDLPELFEQIADDFIEYSDLWNIGMRKMQRKNIIKLLEKSCDEMVDKADKICSDCTEMNLVRVGVFSNGEGVYEMA